MKITMVKILIAAVVLSLLGSAFGQTEKPAQKPGTPPNPGTPAPPVSAAPGVTQKNRATQALAGIWDGLAGRSP